MRYHALAADYDGTLAHHGEIDEPTLASLQRLRDTGRRLIMVTGRELDELLGLLAKPELFDRIVAENGALVYTPATKHLRLVASAPPPRFVDELRRRNVQPLAVGRVIVATWEPWQEVVLETIKELGLELQVIFNKGAVMVLPSGINKAAGLTCALQDLGLSRHSVVAVGDAENDHALLELAECGVAVANALPALKMRADLVTADDHGAGVAELVERVIADDLASVAPTRHALVFGKRDNEEVAFDPYASNIMICGTSGSGKSTLTTALLERLADASYQFAIIDPEGDYTSLDIAVALGGTRRAPLVDEIVDVLEGPQRNVDVNLLGVAVEHRPEFFAQLMPTLSALRTRTGRPHWLVIDEAHHLLPAARSLVGESSPRRSGTLYVTVHPESVAREVLTSINVLLALGDKPFDTLRAFCAAAGHAMPRAAPDKLAAGQALMWSVGQPEAVVIDTDRPTLERTRHSRKYVEGNLGADRSFYFRGPEHKLQLRASNLMSFVELAAGVDDDTWLFHLRNGDYARWLATEVKDPELAEAVARVDHDLPAAASRAEVRAEIEKRYTLPADHPSGIVDGAPAA